MPHALVVFESMYGNTQKVAQAVAAGLLKHMTVDVVEVSAAPTELDEDVVLVVGAPTHAFGLPRARTRQSAAEQAPDGLVSAGAGVREWLASVGGVTSTTRAVSFDTRNDKPRVPGSAAKAAERRLRRRGFRIAAPAANFYVGGIKGPLRCGELERAQAWGDHLGAQLAPRGGVSVR